MSFLGKDLWHMILRYPVLSYYDVAKMRQCEKKMCILVNGMNKYWYCAYQQFLCTHEKFMKVDRALKRHKPSVGYNCFAYREIDFSGFNDKRECIDQKIKLGELSEKDCRLKHHWTLCTDSKLSERYEFSGYNQKKRYIFYYMKSCFEASKSRYDRIRTELQSEVAKLEDTVKTLIEAKARLEVLERRFAGNNVFENKRIDTYGGIDFLKRSVDL